MMAKIPQKCLVEELKASTNTLQGEFMKFVIKMLIILSMTCQIAHAEERALMAVTAINDMKERDTMNLPNCEGSRNAKTTHIKMKVNRYKIDLYKLSVTFENGNTQELFTRKRFKKGSTSEWLELIGGPRCVRRISITADANILGLALRKKAHVSFYRKM